MSIKYQAHGKSLKMPDYSIIMCENEVLYGNSDHTSPLTLNCGFRKVEECQIVENKGLTKENSSIEVSFPINDPISGDKLDYTIEVSNLFRYGIKTFEKITYEHSNLQLLYGVKENGEKNLLFFIGGEHKKFKFGAYFLDGLEDHTGYLYYSVNDPKKYNPLLDSSENNLAIMEFYYLGNPLNFIYFPKKYKESNLTIIKYPGEDGITGYKANDLYLPNEYKIESELEEVRQLDLILKCIDDPHIKKFYIPVPFMVKTNGKYPIIDFKSISSLSNKNQNSSHYYMGVTYGKKESHYYIRDYLEVEYYESSLEYGVKQLGG